MALFTRIMITKLTLTIDESVIAMSKQYARAKGQSLSQLVENYLKSVSLEVPEKDRIIPSVQKLVGVLKLPKHYDYKKELAKELARKYKK